MCRIVRGGGEEGWARGMICSIGRMGVVGRGLVEGKGRRCTGMAG